MKKKDIRTYFKAITEGNLEKAAELIETDRSYLTVCSFAPPKKNDGQSGLQVAFKTGNFDIAGLLIEKGADVNFMETSAINEWTAPVLHDCIRAMIFNTYTLRKNEDRFNQAYSLFQQMLQRKADPNAVDSYGNNCLHRAILDANQMISHPNADLSGGILLQQLRKIFKTLISAGADIHRHDERRPDAESLIKNFRLENYRLW
jgi:ankyrin repeat protein